MNIYAFICTRSNKPGKSFEKLVKNFISWGIHVKILRDKNSIYEAYSDVYATLEYTTNDIVIMCHDDIEILSSKEHFLNCLAETSKPEVGFIGVAGTTRLTQSGVWWDKENIINGFGRGSVAHTNELHPSCYGPTGEVIVMDGLFLAANAKTLGTINLDKPKYFDGGWDFYDIMFCHRMRETKRKNIVVPLLLRHHSRGELVGRDGWHFNRQAFIEQHLKGRIYAI